MANLLLDSHAEEQCNLTDFCEVYTYGPFTQTGWYRFVLHVGSAGFPCSGNGNAYLLRIVVDGHAIRPSPSGFIEGDAQFWIMTAPLPIKSGQSVSLRLKTADDDNQVDVATDLYDVTAYEQSIDEKLPTDTTTKLNHLNADVTSRATPADIPTPAEIDAELTANHGVGTWSDTGAGFGDVEVDHNYGGIDNLRYVHGEAGVDGGIIRAYLKSEYDAGTYTKRGEAKTGSDGRWISPMYLDAGTYYLTFSKPGVYATSKVEVEVS